MQRSTQVVNAGLLENAYRREYQKLVAANALSRLWAKDLTLWPEEERRRGSPKNNLAWLDLPQRLGPYMTLVVQHTGGLEEAGFKDLVFVGMGSANLAAETVANLPISKRGNRFFVLDSTDPSAIRNVEKELDLHHTLFAFASKSGKHIETHSLLLYFMVRLRASGVKSPGLHFLAGTEENSYLVELARGYGFRGIFLDPPGISGRYSSLIHFGLLLSTLCRVDPSIILDRVTVMHEACSAKADSGTNPAVALGAWLAAGALEGNGRLLLLTSRSLSPFSDLIAQAVGTSTGKGGRGILPIAGDVPGNLEVFHHKSLAAEITMRGEDATRTKEAVDSLARAGVPLVRIEIGGPEDLGAELFKWEVGSALACANLGVDPFEEPDTQDAREKTSEILGALSTNHVLPAPTVRVREGGIELYAEKVARQEISTLNLGEALRTFFELRKREGALVILIFLNRNPEREALLLRLREKLALGLQIPVVVSYGPRYLYSLGQVYKGGPPTSLFLVVTAKADEDLDIPGAGYTFGQLNLALALGDFEALGSRARPVLRLNFSEGAEEGFKQLEGVVQRSLAHLSTFRR